MRGGGGSGRPGGWSRRRLLVTLITLMLLAMIAGLAAGLIASLGHWKHQPAARRPRACWQAHARGPAVQRELRDRHRDRGPRLVPRHHYPGPPVRRPAESDSLELPQAPW